MTLPYHRKPSYLSPSALMKLEQDPVLFYLHRCGPEASAPPREPTELPMVVGSVFDAFVKTELAAVLGCACPTLGELLGAIEVPELIPAASAVAKDLIRVYKASGAFAALLKEGISLVNLDPERQVVPGTARRLMGREVGGVPLVGYPDALIVRPDGTRVVLDWKTTSAGSPQPGWRRKFDSEDVCAQYAPPHEKSVEDFATLHPDWATQLATYSWLLRPGVGLGERFAAVDVAIDQVVYGSKVPRVYQYRGEITGIFQDNLRTRYQAAWERVQQETLVPEDVAATLLQVPERYRGIV